MIKGMKIMQITLNDKRDEDYADNTE
jgi:hypothetical protein